MTVLTARPEGWKSELAARDGCDYGAGDGDGPWVEDAVQGTPVYRYCAETTGGPRVRRARFAAAVYRFCRNTDPGVLQLVAVPLESLPWLAAARRCGVRTVYTETMVTAGASGAPDRLGRRIRALFVSGVVDRFVASSRVMYDALRAEGYRGEIEVIPNGVDLERFRPASDRHERRRLRERLGLPSQAPVAVFVGGVSPRKGIDRLLEAWARVARELKGAHLVIVGPRRDLSDPGLGAFRRRLEELMAAAGGTDRIHFTGLVEDPESYLRAADLFVFASRREGMGNVVMEAMATGLPVVLTPYTGLPAEFGEPGEHYVLAGESPESLARSMIRWLRDSAGARELGRSGREHVRETLDVERSLDRYAALYRELGDG